MQKYKGLSNIEILKKYVAGERPFIKVGYTGNIGKHRENGDVWKDKDGIEWKQEDGVKVRLTRTQGDIIRDAIGKGMNCKRCGMNYKWAGKHDIKFLHRTGLCSDCLIDYETKLRILGIYDDYENYKLTSYQLGMMKDAREKIKDAIKFFITNSGDVEMICNSEGFVERWKTTNHAELLKSAKDDLKMANKKISEAVVQNRNFKKKYSESVKKYKLKFYV